MSNFIDFQTVKQAVSCDRLLADQGYLPSKVHAGYRLYHSPLRQGDSTPSFSVTAEGRWRDFGIGAGGDVIDLVIALGLATTKVGAAEYLIGHYNIGITAEHVPNDTPGPRGTQITSVIPIRSRPLLNYLAGRGILGNIAKYFLVEVHYRTPSGRSYYGAGIANVNGGFAVRSPYHKINVGPAGITILGDVGHGDVAIFEGFMDCLSWMEDTGGIDGDAIILNSTANVGAAIPVLEKYEDIHCYLDRDAAGAKALLRLQREYPGIVLDESGAYEGFKDYNEFYISKLANYK